MSEATTSAPDGGSTRRHIRGSSLLLAGRLISLGINFIVQLLTVRYLSKAEYGAFGYAISVQALAAQVSVFGLDKAVARYVPLFHERGQLERMFGTVVLTLLTILGIGVTIVIITLAGGHVVGPKLIDDPQAIGLLLILIALVPFTALDTWFQGMFAVFAKPKAIFVRRHLLAPFLRLLVIVGVIASGSGVQALAWGYVAGGVIGVASYVTLLLRLFQREGFTAKLLASRPRLPVREVFGFSVPLLTSDVMLMLRTSIVVMLLGYFHDTLQVAEFKAVLPIAGLNLVVMQSFRYLYTPLAARMFARDDRDGINDLYWRTTLWIALISFPVFAASFSLAKPLTLLLYGGRYAGSATVLGILALGNYLNAAFGFTSYTLRVYGKVRYIVTVDVLSGVLSVALALTLIPRYGAVGAAAATTATLILYNLFNYLGLLLGTGIELFVARYLKVYGGIAVASVALFLAQQVFDPPLVVGAVLVGLATLAILRTHRAVLAVGDLFPELRRVALLRPLLGT